MKRILSLMLILIVGAFLFASDNNDGANFSEKLFAQLEQDTLTVTGEDVEPEITEEIDQDTLVTDEEEEEEWEEDKEWDEEEEHGMTLWDFLSKASDSYVEKFLEDSDFDRRGYKQEKRKRGYFRFGAGGWDAYMLPLNIDNINSKLSGVVQIDEFDSEMFLNGGGGWGYLSKKLRVGGIGFSGAVVSDGQKDDIGKEVTLRISSGGVTIDRVFHPLNKSEIYVGAMIGGGTASLKFVQWTGPLKWKQLWDDGYSKTDTTGHDFYDYKTEIKSHFITLIPTIGVRYNILRWCAIGANVGYFYTMIDNDGWKMGGKRVNDVPKIDFSNIFYRVNIYFGG